MNLKQFFMLIFFFGIISEDTPVVSSESIPEVSMAGEELLLTFNTTSAEALLILKNAYGSTAIKAEKSNNSVFKVPKFMSDKSGILRWKYLNKKSSRSGEINILPQTTPKLIETYFGPRSIQAGYDDFSMLVSIPTDSLDNPLADGTSVNISEFFQGSLWQQDFQMEHMFAWKNINTREKAGKITVATSAEGVAGKEMISNVYPSLASDFSITTNSEHLHADGNQVTQLITSPITDDFGNIVSDGTSVEFVVETEKGLRLKTSANTINGVATAQLLHPEEAGSWSIQANVTGMAISNSLSIEFEPVLTEIPHDISDRNITVGPLKSFMNQSLPDGAEVHFQIVLENEDIYKEKVPTQDGVANFKIPKTIALENIRVISVKTMGVHKKIDL
ncbi:invasin domain 3-containing protein [Christiangramia sp. ASW11-125]|uniref:invasin domain 3-containing protein n=1 Tax=Christiangramia sp. ASW11-125 TaxID=3400701 RepID=UPI003AAF1E2D